MQLRYRCRRARSAAGGLLGLFFSGALSTGWAMCPQLADTNSPILLLYMHGNRPERHCIWRGSNTVIATLDTTGRPRSWTLRQGRYSLEIQDRLPSGTSRIRFQYRNLSRDLNGLRPGEMSTYEFVASTDTTQMVERNSILMVATDEALVSGCRLDIQRIQRTSTASSGASLHFEYDHAPLVNSFVVSTSYRTNAEGVRTGAPLTSRLVAVESREEALAVCGERPTVFD